MSLTYCASHDNDGLSATATDDGYNYAPDPDILYDTLSAIEYINDSLDYIEQLDLPIMYELTVTPRGRAVKFGKEPCEPRIRSPTNEDTLTSFSNGLKNEKG